MAIFRPFLVIYDLGLLKKQLSKIKVQTVIFNLAAKNQTHLRISQLIGFSIMKNYQSEMYQFESDDWLFSLTSCAKNLCLYRKVTTKIFMDCLVSLTESRFKKFVHRLGKNSMKKIDQRCRRFLVFQKKMVITMSLNLFQRSILIFCSCIFTMFFDEFHILVSCLLQNIS